MWRRILSVFRRWFGRDTEKLTPEVPALLGVFTPDKDMDR